MWIIFIIPALGILAGVAYFAGGGTIRFSNIPLVVIGFIVLCLLNWLASLLMRGEREGVYLSFDSDDNDDLPPRDRPEPPPTPPGGATLSIGEKHKMLYDAVSKVVDNADKVRVRR